MMFVNKNGLPEATFYESFDKMWLDWPNNDYKPTEEELEKIIRSLMYSSCMVSNMRKPESDNMYGRAATALRYLLPKDNPLNPFYELEYPKDNEII